MVMATGKVVDGKVIVDGDPLPEGITVAIYYEDAADDFRLSPEQVAQLEHSIAQADRGETIPAEDVRAELRARTKALRGRVSP